MTTTPGAGTYLVLFNADMEHATANATITYALYANSVQVADSVRTCEQPIVSAVGTPAIRNYGTQSIITVAAGQAIEVRAAETGAGILTIHNRSLTLLKIA